MQNPTTQVKIALPPVYALSSDRLPRDRGHLVGKEHPPCLTYSEQSQLF